MSSPVLDPEPGVRCAVADNPSPMTLDGTRNYLVGRDRAVLLDPGPADDGQGERLRRLVRGRRVSAVALTHAHPDHAGGAPELARELGVPLAASGATLRRLGADGRDLADGQLLPEDGDDGDGLRALATPGHSADHLAFWWPGRRALFTGDLVLGSGSAMVGHPDGHMGDCLASLERLSELGARRLYPGHGDPVDDPGARLAAYRDHRLEREERIRRAVEAGAASVAEIRRRAYDRVPDDLEWAAGASIRAHLLHLEEQGVELPEIEGREDGRGDGAAH